VPALRPIIHLIAVMSAAVACASPPASEQPAADPDATWERATTKALRAHRSNRKGDLIIAESNYERALAAAQSFPEEDPRLLETRYALARLHRKQGRYGRAIRELEALVPEQERLHGASSAAAVATLLTLCGARVDAGRYEAGRATCLRVLAIQQADPDAAATAIGATKLQLAVAEGGLRRFDAAEEIYLGLLAQMQPDRSSAALAGVQVKCHDGLGVLYTSQRRYSEAEPQHLKALSILVRRRGRKSPEYAIVLRDLGDLYVQTRRYDDARERYDEARELFEETLGKDHFQVRDTMLRIADVLARTGKPREAADLRYQAQSIPDPRT
jgi:tetratricopeptide (TPR) repeat protein